MAMENKRIIQLSTERTNLTSGDYVMVDSDADGSAKYRLDRLKETDTTLSVSGMAADAAATGQAISAEATARGNAVTAEAEARAAAVTAEATARQTADTTLQGNITAEATARAAADTAIGEDIDDLKSALYETIDRVNTADGFVFTALESYWNISGNVGPTPNDYTRSPKLKSSVVLVPIGVTPNTIRLWKNGTLVSGSGVAWNDVGNIDYPFDEIAYNFANTQVAIGDTVTLVKDGSYSLVNAESDIKDTISKLDLSLPLTFTDNIYIKKTTGEEVANSAYCASGYIPVVSLLTYGLTTAMYNDASGVCFYKSNTAESYISGYNINTSGKIETNQLSIPATAKYIRFTCLKSLKSDAQMNLVKVRLAIESTGREVPYKSTLRVVPSWTYGYYVNKNGELVQNNGYRYTDVTLDKYDTLKASETDPSGNAVAFLSLWTTDNTFISVIALGSTTLQTVTTGYYRENTKIRICVYQNDSTFVADINKVIMPDLLQSVIEKTAQLEIADENNIGKINISMFESIGACGDSFTAGALFNGNETVGEFEKISWAKMLSRLVGFEATIYAQGGTNTSTFITRETCLPAILNDDPKQLYILCLGINDADAITLGTSADIDDDYTHTPPNTFYGNYGYIIANIKHHAPNALIVICKTFLPGYHLSNYYEYSSDAIEEIAEHFSIPYIETKNAPFLMSDAYNTNVRSNKGHPTAPYYSGIADSMKILLNQCMNDNLSYFVHFNPTT